MKNLLITFAALLLLGIVSAAAAPIARSSAEIDAAVAAGWPGLTAQRCREIAVGVRRASPNQYDEIYAALRNSSVKAEREFADALFVEGPLQVLSAPPALIYQLQVRRGAAAELATITPALAEPCYTTDTKELIMGDGVTPGGVRLVPTYANAAPGQVFSFIKSAIDFTVTGNVDLFSVRTGRTFVVTGVYAVSTDTGHTSAGPAIALTNSVTGQMTATADSEATTAWASAPGRSFSIPMGGDPGMRVEALVVAPSGSTVRLRVTGADSNRVIGTVTVIGFYLEN
jgi:Major tropism determinant N-terminal domain